MSTEEMNAYRQAIKDVNQQLTFYLNRPNNQEDRDSYLSIINDLTAYLHHKLLAFTDDDIGSGSTSTEMTFEEMVEHVTGTKL